MYTKLVAAVAERIH